jgi:hypothetical protein
MENKKNFLTAIIISAIHYLIVILSFKSAPFSKLINAHDSSMFMYFGKGMSEGIVPYKEMFDHKGIVLFWIQQLGTIIGLGNYSTGVWIVELIFYFVTIFFIFKSCYILTKNYLATGIAILLLTGPAVVTIQNGNYSEEFALTFISIALYLFIKEYKHDFFSKYRLFFIGITGALTFFIRPNMVALWVVFCLYFLFKGIKNKDHNRLFSQILWIFLGGFLVCLFVAAYSLIKGNLSDMLYQTFVLNAQYSADATLLDKLLTAKSFLEFSTRIGITAFVFLFLLSLLIFKDKLSQNVMTLFYLLFIYLVVNFATVILSGRYYNHYYATMLPILVVITSIAVHLLSSLLNNKKKKLILYILFFSLTMSYSYLAVKDVVKPVLINNNIPTEQTTQIDQAKYIRKNTSSKDRIYVHNIDANIYLLSDRFANTKYFVLPSLDYRNFSNLRNDFVESFNKNLPKFISIRAKNYYEQNPDDSKLDKSLIDILNRKYTSVDKFENKEILLFKLK